MADSEFLCFAHRGAMGHAAQNTLAAVERALQLGAPWIEIDVYRVDGHLVVFHDDRLDDLTNGSGYLTDQSFSYLRSLEVLSSGQGIPTLHEVCERVAGRAGLNIELKGSDTADAVCAYIDTLLAGNWHSEQLLVSSFNHRELQRVKQLNPVLRLGALHCSLPVDNARFAEQLGAYSLHPSLEFVDQQLIDDAHQRGLKVYVYTVNHPDDIARMQQLGADGVFTNYPERVLGTMRPE